MSLQYVLLITFLAAALTDVATGLGVIPLFFVRSLSERVAGILMAAAAGMMISASVVMMIAEGLSASEGDVRPVALGVLMGGVFFAVASRWVKDHKSFDVAGLRAQGGAGALLVVAAMTIHSLPEGIAIGVAFGNAERTNTLDFGFLMCAALAIHNIPEGLAIGLALRPRGISPWRCVGWAIFSSIPQPVAAVPAAWAVWLFQPLLPGAMGFAAGAMLWLVASDLIPECVQKVGIVRTTASAIVGFAVMWGVTIALGQL